MPRPPQENVSPARVALAMLRPRGRTPDRRAAAGGVGLRRTSAGSAARMRASSSHLQHREEAAATEVGNPYLFDAAPASAAGAALVFTQRAARRFARPAEHGSGVND